MGKVHFTTFFQIFVHFSWQNVLFLAEFIFNTTNKMGENTKKKFEKRGNSKFFFWISIFILNEKPLFKE